MSDLVTQFDKSSIEYADNISFIFNDLKYTYKQINEATGRLANGLIKAGFQKGDKVALILPNYIQFPICYFALLKIGAVVCPINFLFDEEQIRVLLEKANVKGIITWETFAKKAQKAATSLKLRTPIILLGNKIPDQYLDLTHLISTAPALKKPFVTANNDPAVILPTAATSGKPKAVVLSHGNLLSNSIAFKEHFYINSNDRFVSVVPLFHPLGLITTLTTGFCFGASQVLHSRFDPKDFLNSIEKNQITSIIGVPSVYRALHDHSESGTELKSVRFCVSAWHALSDAVAEAFEAKFKKVLFQAYGLTEATATVTANRIELERRPGSVGLPMHQITLQIVDDQNNELPIGEIGEIAVQGPNVMLGYLGEEEETRQTLQDNWLRTGDLGKLDESGRLYVIERKDFVINKAGFRVFPKEIESHLLTHPKVQETAVIGFSDSANGEEVKACIVPKDGQNITSEEIIEYCREAFAMYQCPSIVQICKNLPKSSTGKLLRYKLKTL